MLLCQCFYFYTSAVILLLLYFCTVWFVSVLTNGEENFFFDIVYRSSGFGSLSPEKHFSLLLLIPFWRHSRRRFVLNLYGSSSTEKKLSHISRSGEMSTLLWGLSLARKERPKPGERGAEMLDALKNCVNLNFPNPLIRFSLSSSDTPQKRFLNPVLYCTEWNAKMNGFRQEFIIAITMVV